MNDSTVSSPAINLREAVKNLDALPAMPVIAQKLLALNTDTDQGERQMLLLVEQDPLISAKIISLSNAPILGATRKISSIKDAAMLLGLKKIKSVATGIAMMSLKSKSSTGLLNLQDLWLHNLGIAFAMQAIVRAMPRTMRPADDQVFLAGMLHDIGYLALAHLDPRRSDELHTYLAARTKRPALQIERSILEMSHDELGGELARQWHLPDEIAMVIRFHHNPDVNDSVAKQPLVRMVYIAEKLLPSFGINEYVEPGVSDADWEALGIDAGMSEEIVGQIAEQADQAALFAASFS